MAPRKDKAPFVFPADLGAGHMNPDVRQATALEFIAHYLDRIEGHLERLATAAENGTGTEKLRAEVSKIAHVLPRLLGGKP